MLSKSPVALELNSDANKFFFFFFKSASAKEHRKAVGLFFFLMAFSSSLLEDFPAVRVTSFRIPLPDLTLLLLHFFFVFVLFWKAALSHLPPLSSLCLAINKDRCS